MSVNWRCALCGRVMWQLRLRTPMVAVGAASFVSVPVAQSHVSIIRLLCEFKQVGVVVHDVCLGTSSLVEIGLGLSHIISLLLEFAGACKVTVTTATTTAAATAVIEATFNHETRKLMRDFADHSIICHVK